MDDTIRARYDSSRDLNNKAFRAACYAPFTTLDFFTTGQVQASDDPGYLGFERAFPAADAWLAIASVICAEGLRRRRAWAVLYGIAAGSAFIYLGLMDTLYNLEHAMYFHLSGEMLAETGINLSCFFFGPVLMSYLWHHRKWLGV